MSPTLLRRLPSKQGISRRKYNNLKYHLSQSELHAATTAFNKARGNCHGLNIDRFRDAFLHEAFAAIPEYVVQRIFRAWNACGGGELSYPEFVAGVAAASKGSRDDHLDMVFRMLSPNGDSKVVSRSDVKQFLNHVAPPSACVAVEKGKTTAASRSWSADELLHLLFGSSVTLTAEKFRAVLGPSSSFGDLLFLDWISNLAQRIIKPIDVDKSAHVGRFTGLHLFTPRQGLSTKQREAVHLELRSILFDISTGLPASSIVQRFREILADDSLVNTTANAWQQNRSAKRTEFPFADGGGEELKLFVLELCCAHASSVQQVYRFLFELFDEYSCGQIDVEQLSTFLQLTLGLSLIDSEREASIIIRRRGRVQSLSSPPPSPTRSPTERPVSAQVLNLAQFVEVAQQQPGFSVAELETALLHFHLKLFTPIIGDHSPVSLLHLLNNDFLDQNSRSDAFCLMSPNEWQQLIKELFQCPPISSAQANVQIIHERATQLPSGHVMITLPDWLLISFWYGINSKSQQPFQYSAIWPTTVQRGLKSLFGFWIRISISFTGRDGFERTAAFTQTIVFDQCTVQNVVDAALYQRGWCEHGDARSKLTTTYQGQVLVAERSASGEIKTTIVDDPVILQQDELGSPLSELLRQICPSWTSESAAIRDILAFEFRLSVVEIEETQEGESTSGMTDVALDLAEMNEQNLLQQLPLPAKKYPRGLDNLGNTCFMNAVLQCLAATPMLTSQVDQRKQGHRVAAPSSQASSRASPMSSSESKSFREILGNLFADMSEAGTTTSVSAKQLLEAFSVASPHMVDGNQQDAQEFLVCLLGHLGNELKRNSMRNGASTALSPRSHAFLTRLFTSKDEKQGRSCGVGNDSLRFAIEDSNGRHDRLVATEWWVSHLIHEPSAINLLFSGQFKSNLTCDRCKYQSSRFEPFSSLQLPLEKYNSDLSTATDRKQDLVVIIHSEQPRGAVRVVVQIDEHASVAALLAQLPTLRPRSSRYIIGSLDSFTIQNLLVSDTIEDQVEETTPASALSHPIHAFELFHIDGNGDDTTAPTPSSTQLYLRFVHRQSFLVPFYGTTPIRQALCGSPFVCTSTRGALTGQILHQMVCQRFLLGRSAQPRSRSDSVGTSAPSTASSAYSYAPTFTLRRVRDDCIACSRCHWSSGCKGCEISPSATAAELLDLDNCETIAIDWGLHLHPQDASAFWWLQSYATIDHISYAHYLRTKTLSLVQSFHSLCSIEHLDAHCSHCQQESPTTPTPHTKQLSLWSLPPILVLQLKRFELSTTNGFQWRKLSHNVDFPIHDLDLRDLLAPVENAHDDSQPCTSQCSIDSLDARVRRGIDFLQDELHLPLNSASRSCTKFDLYAVVNHSGPGIGSGHYTAQFRRPTENCWWNANDTVVTQQSEQDLSPSATAYLLFYVRQDVADRSDLFQ